MSVVAGGAGGGGRRVQRLPVDAPTDTGDGAAVLGAYAATLFDGRGPAMLGARRSEPGCSFPFVRDGDAVVAFAWGAAVPEGSWWPTALAGVLGPAVAADVVSGSSVASIGVRAGFRRRGLGALVLDALLTDLAPLGGPVHLGTQADNVPSRALYASRGFESVAVFSYPGQDQQWLLMRRPPTG